MQPETITQVDGWTLLGHNPEDEALLADWWEELATSGELEQTLGKAVLGIGAFFRALDGHSILIQRSPFEQPTAVTWLAPFLDGFFFSVWLAKTWRGPDGPGRGAALSLYQALFAAGVPFLVSLTRQESVLLTMQDVGYTDTTTVRWDGEPAWLAWLRPSGLNRARVLRRSWESLA